VWPPPAEIWENVSAGGIASPERLPPQQITERSGVDPALSSERRNISAIMCATCAEENGCVVEQTMEGV
jgi:hypothetical protein